MSEEQTQELVTKIDVQPDLSGLLSFQQEIDKATAKVNELSAAIRKANELQPKSRYAPPVNNPAATAAAAGLAGGFGANLVKGAGLAPIIKKATEDVAKSTALALRAGGAGRVEYFGGRGGAGGGLVPFNSLPAESAGGALARYRSPVEDMDLSGYRAPDAGLTIGGKKPVADAVRKATGFKAPNMLAGAATAYGLARGLDAVAESMDKVQSQEQQLERLPQTLGSGKAAYIELTNAASQVRSDGDAFISTYTNMATATEKLGLSQKETQKATQGLVSSLQLGGGSKEAVTNALYQMGQAFSSDRFGGDEFRSFMEAIGTQAPAVAKAFGTDVKGLRAMSEAGKLTAETMVKAFEKMADQNISLLNKQGWTWGQVTTVMKNDWNSFLAEATSDGEWSRLMSYIANNITPTMREAEQSVAAFWSTMTDQSKANILLGILAAIGAGFVALAVPVMAAVWPFLAVGAAVWVLFELFTEFKDWMDGNAKTIFDSLFGSFDEFEKRYPNIVAGLRALGKAADTAKQGVESVPGVKGVEQTAGVLATPSGLFGNALGFVEKNLNPLPGVEKFLSLFGGSSESTTPSVLTPPSINAGGNKQTTITNSGNTTIQVATPEEAVAVASKRDAAFISHYDDNSIGNIAESGGWM